MKKEDLNAFYEKNGFELQAAQIFKEHIDKLKSS